MNWAEEPDPAAGDEASYEPEPGMDEAAFDEPQAEDVGDYDTEDASLDAEGGDSGDETAAASEEDGTGDDPAAETGDGDGDGDIDDPAAETDPDFDSETDPAPDEGTGADDQADPDAEAIEITDDEVVGTDPDADLAADDPAFEAEFPPDIDLDARPEPVDGEPWSDASLLGSTGDAGTDWAAYDFASPPMDDLFAMDGASSGGWESLTGSDDPAVSSLARWWQPT